MQDDQLAGRSLNWIDFGWRMYDPQLGRWHVIDNLAENSISMTPYGYCLNNPIAFFDPDGNDEFYFDQNGKLYSYQVTDKPNEVYNVTVDENDEFNITDIEQVEMEPEELQQKMDENGFKEVTKEETVIETTTETQYTDADGGLRTTSSNTTTDKVLERSTMYTQKENDVVSTKREYQATLKRDDVGPVVSRTERVKKSYEYGNKKGVDTNTVLEVVKTLVQGYFGSKK